MALKVSPNKIIEYKAISNKSYNRISANNLKQLTAKKNKDISLRTKSQLTDLLTTWLKVLMKRAADNKVLAKVEAKPLPSPIQSVVCNSPTFITLTFPIEINESQAKYKLKCFIQYIVRHGTTDYFWKSEQHQSGLIHFHLITDSCNDTYTQKWNALTGSVECVIEEVRSVKKVVGYVLKSTEIEINGKLWGKSKSLNQYKPTTLDNHQGNIFLIDHRDELTKIKEADYYKIHRPSKRLSSEIIATYLT